MTIAFLNDEFVPWMGEDRPWIEVFCSEMASDDSLPWKIDWLDLHLARPEN